VSERRTITVGALARVEGEGALHMVVEGGRLTELRLEIYEPPRFFEAFLRGRAAAELPDLVARICGICPVAYQMSAVQALEAVFGVEIEPGIRALRRLYYCGEWLESHLLHMVFLAAPDFLGLDDGFEVARLHRAEVERALRLRKLGNRIISLLGARPVNPVGVCVGGFHRIPSRAELSDLAEELRRARGEAETLLRWLASLAVPARPSAIELVSLRHAAEYPMNEGRIISSAGLDLPAPAFFEHFAESQVPHSNALHCRRRDGGGPYLVGPLARLLLNRDHLSPAARAACDALGPRFERPDPYASLFARGIEVIQAIDDALHVLDGFEPPRRPSAEWEPRTGVGHGATEAPRGLLYIRVETDGRGDVAEIRIVPPTSQNQARIEEDLRELAPEVLTLSDEDARRRCETAIRNYDPCISCATHFLRLDIERRPGSGSPGGEEPCASS
jgi:coenzyme F420-reducing hydrogenase alpha subunit